MTKSSIHQGGLLLLLATLLSGAARAQSVDFNFSSLGTALIAFDGSGSALSFSPDAATGYDFQIGSSSLPGLVGYTGVIAGNFTIGQVTSFGMGFFQGEDATVTGSGRLSIFDGSNPPLTADITWNTVATLGTEGVLNSIGTPNLSNFAYSGSNPVLTQLAGASGGTVAASFQFLPTESLGNLAAGGGTNATTFSGSLEAIPENQNTVAILGGLVLLGAIAIRGHGRRNSVAGAPNS